MLESFLVEEGLIRMRTCWSQKQYPLVVILLVVITSACQNRSCRVLCFGWMIRNLGPAPSRFNFASPLLQQNRFAPPQARPWHSSTVQQQQQHQGGFVTTRGRTIRWSSATATMTTSGSNKASENYQHIILHWFRLGDLRLHDNPALVHSCQLASKKLVSRTSGTTTSQQEAETLVLPWFHFDCQNIFGSSVGTEWGSVKCGPRRAQFIVESVQDLQQQLRQECQCPLLISHGAQAPHEFVSQLMQTVSASLNSEQQPRTKIQWTIICQEEVLQEEQDAVKAMRAIVPSSDDTRYNGVETVWGSTMYELDDVAELFGGNNLVDMPNSFTPFRNKVEKNCEIATPLASPRKLLQTLVPSPKNSRIGRALEPLMTRSQQVPSLKDLGYSDESIKMVETVDPRGVMQFRGGTLAALARVKDYIFTEDLLRVYFDTRNGMLGANYSTKLSPWLAHGCLSPRLVAQECRRYETERGIQNKSTYWLIFELLWRDYCKFFATKHGNKLFFPQGILDEKSHGAFWWKMDSTILAAWKDGRTGYPLVDANMRELQATGFMSNRGRQNVCSFLALDLQQDWRYGADYFESTLLDYDVYSNWYNWCAVRSIQSLQCDGKASYMSIWKDS